ncbi:hypothetical protein [Paenibacillus periandrae]|uniref:hypothetical protein n=1 Tax=Paenibacillus periandrae TaxID=1761741 RepID=UPI001F095D48|nr:hypothetical protein [Paenibacillus periandrae]
MNEQVKIRQIEMDILTLLRNGVVNTLEVADHLKLTYSAVHSIINRMVMYEIAHRKGNGKYSPTEGDFITASDEEVIAYRRKKKNGLTKDSSSVLDIPVEIVEYVSLQYRSNVDRNVILTRLNKKGIQLTKFSLNQIIYIYGIDREFPQRNRESNLLVMV